MVSKEKIFLIICLVLPKLLKWKWQMLLSLCFVMFWKVYFNRQQLLCCYGRSYCQCGRCYCHLLIDVFLADVIAKDMADVIANNLWLMLLPCDWWYCHNWLLLYWLMLLPMLWLMFFTICGRWNSHFLCDGLMLLPCGRCYSHLIGMCTDVIWPDGVSHWVNYLSLSSLLLLRTSSHIWGRWYLPMFLFRDGPFNSYVHGFFNQPRETLFLPTHYLKVVKCGSVTWGVTMVMNGWGGLEMFFKSLSKWSWCFSNVLLITFQSVTFESVNYPTLFCYMVFIFWCHQFIFYCPSTFKMYLDAILLSNVFYNFHWALGCRGL